MLELGQILQATGVAVLVAMGLFLALAHPWRQPNPTRLALGWTLAVGAGGFLGLVLIGIECRWPPTVVQQRVLLILWPVAVFIECIGGLEKVPRWVPWALRLLLAACVPTILLFGTSYLNDFNQSLSEWSVMERMFWLSGLTIALLAVWVPVQLQATHTPGWRLCLLLTLIGGAATVAAMCSEYPSAGGFMAPLLAIMVALGLASLLIADRQQSAGAVGLFCLGLFSLLVISHFLAGMTLLHAGILWSSMLIVSWDRIPGIAKRNDWCRLGVPSMILVLVLAGVVWQAWQQFQTGWQPQPTPIAPDRDGGYWDDMSTEEVNKAYEQFKTNQSNTKPPEPEPTGLFGN